ncbi:hypothetical protein E2C01_012885 [Portunus trituberculatus]|uniref:Uncharacterized protein n=1 Tax=Portunus trituberculatus TaxID=210409 RepID=A0A5B7DFT3_PORTR|nr:hypothetical protein [Portunus trituberculatus]
MAAVNSLLKFQFQPWFDLHQDVTVNTVVFRDVTNLIVVHFINELHHGRQCHVSPSLLHTHQDKMDYEELIIATLLLLDDSEEEDRCAGAWNAVYRVFRFIEQ